MSLDTQFADMPQPVRNRWLDWANSHDWGGEKPYFYRDLDGNCYLVTSVAVYMDGTGWTTENEFNKTPRAMREWAGY